MLQLPESRSADVLGRKEGKRQDADGHQECETSWKYCVSTSAEVLRGWGRGRTKRKQNLPCRSRGSVGDGWVGGAEVRKQMLRHGPAAAYLGRVGKAVVE